MEYTSAKRLGTIAVVLAVCGSSAAWGEQYQVVGSETGTICETGTKSEPAVIEGRDDVVIAGADSDTLNRAICVSDSDRNNVHIQWKASGSWKSSGNIGHGCAEILGASQIKVRPVATGLSETATYYTCSKE
jgi:hypothetical protein